MKIAVLKERRQFENRVAATPETVKKLIALGCSVTLEKGAGLGSSFQDDAYKAAGATIAKDAATTVKDADVILKVSRPLSKEEGDLDEISLLPQGSALISVLNPLMYQDQVKAYGKSKVTACALDLVPRITRAQVMDVLSSQANLAGYRAVIESAFEYGGAFPMMMTAAGTIAPARVLILGAGVAGLQAIATARRLGAIVSAFDVRAAAKEQVESLGATFVEVEASGDAETAGGYAKEMDDDYKRRQGEKIAEVAAKADIIICTALIPGKKAPILLTEAVVKTMKAGSIIIDLAAENGGNCEVTKPGEIALYNDVKIVGHGNFAARIARDASNLYARNVLAYLTLLLKDGKLNWNFEDEILQGSILTHNGKVIHPSFTKDSKAA